MADEIKQETAFFADKVSLFHLSAKPAPCAEQELSTKMMFLYVYFSSMQTALLTF